MDPLRLFHTARHLRAGQVTDRLLRRFRPVPSRWEEAGQYRLLARAAELPASGSDRRVVDGGFRFLNVSCPFEGAERWSPSGASRLWAYQLHYFRWVWELPPARAFELFLDWLSAHPPLAAPGWEPYPLSMRIREWVEWLLAHPDLPADDHARLVASLAHQVRALEAQLEYHLLGNHLLENAVTLCWAGLSLQGPSASRWRDRGLRLLQEQLAEQVLADGTHDERSPMYQALLAEGLLRLARVASGVGALGGPQAPEAQRIADLALGARRRLVASLQKLTHNDGQIALFNDSAFGEAPTYADLVKRFPEAAPQAPLKEGVWALPAAGYFGLRRGGVYLAFDAGAIGPDHQPGHGHAGALSFELSHRGRRLVTDTGVLTYEPGAARASDRGTAAHNTIEVDGRDQSELWAAFRCGRRIGPVSGTAGSEGGTPILRGSYVGPGAWRHPVHHSRTCLFEDGRLSFDDQLAVRGAHTAVARLHVGPGLGIVQRQGCVEVTDGGTPLLEVRGEGFGWQVDESPYHPEFGREILRPCLVTRLTFRERLRLGWSLRLL